MDHKLIALVLGLLLIVAAAGSAQAAGFGLARLGVGAYGVSNVPLVQEDAENGPLFGIRGRLGVLHALAIEPSVNFLSNGDAELTQEGSSIRLEAPSVTNFSLNLVWGGTFYGTAGIGWTSLDLQQPGLDATLETTYNFGLGTEIPFGPIAIDAGARLYIINNADSASRKHLAIMAGANYYIF